LPPLPDFSSVDGFPPPALKKPDADRLRLSGSPDIPHQNNQTMRAPPLNPQERAPAGGTHRPVEYIPALFLMAAAAFFPTGPESGALDALAIVFVSIVLEAIPFMLVGSLIGGLIEAFVSRERLAALLPRKGWRTVCMAAGAGIVFPVCECAVVPVVRRLTGKGLPLSAAIAYLLGGPIVNPIVAASTALAYAFDWRIVILRLSLGYGIAVVIGLIMGKLFTGAAALRENGIACHGSDASCGCGHAHTKTADGWIDKAGSAFTHAMDDFFAVGHYLVIGAFIAALAQTYIERSSFLGLSGMPFISVLLMMVLAVLLNLCSEADAFIAASFQGLISVPAQMAFLLTGPMFDLKLLLMYRTVFRQRAIVVLASLILGTVLTVAIGLEMFNGGAR